MKVRSMQIADIAALLNRAADLLEIQEANAFRIRAYRNAARVVESHGQNIADMVERGEDLTQLPGIGKDLAGKIGGIAVTGRFALLDELEKEVPGGLAELMNISGMGGRRVHDLHEKLHVDTLADLEHAARDHHVQELSGFGEKSEKSILEGIARLKEAGKRVRLASAEAAVAPLVAHLKKAPGVDDLVIAGSYRRRLDTVGDVDLLVTLKGESPVMDRFTGFERVAQVVAKGPTRSTVLLKSGLQVDLRVVAADSYGAALVYFTGSKAHGIAIRNRAVRDGLKINEYGVFRGEKRVAGATEEDVYASIGLAWIPPELREDRGEVESAAASRLPRLVTEKDIRGDLHMHTNRTDGNYSLEEMVRAAHAKGYEYVANTEHSQRIAMAHGLRPQDLRDWLREIERVQKLVPGITILKGIEVDILEDGSLDLPDDVLRELDLTVCSVHSKFKLSQDKQTERILRAMDNRYFRILGHPSGRVLGQRPPYDVDMGRIIRGAKERGRILEVNSSPERMDLTDVNVKAAVEAGVFLSVDTDAHSVADYDNIRFGISQARRGWAGPEQIINTRSLRELKKLLAGR